MSKQIEEIKEKPLTKEEFVEAIEKIVNKKNGGIPGDPLPKNPNKGQKIPELTPEQRGKEYLKAHPNIGFDHVLVTSDGTVFFPNKQGENCAINYSRTLKNALVINVEK